MTRFETAASAARSCGGAAEVASGRTGWHGERLSRAENFKNRIRHCAERRSGSCSARVDGLKVLVGAGSGVQL